MILSPRSKQTIDNTVVCCMNENYEANKRQFMLQFTSVTDINATQLKELISEKWLVRIRILTFPWRLWLWTCHTVSMRSCNTA